MARYINISDEVADWFEAMVARAEAMQKAATLHANQTPAMRKAQLWAVTELTELFQSLYDSVIHCKSCGHRFKVDGDDRRYQDVDGRTTGRCDECEYEYATDPDNKWAAIL